MDKVLPGSGIEKFLALAVIVSVWVVTPARGGTGFTVFAAASMQNVLEEMIDAYEQKCACSIVLSSAATSVLARQIEAGAPADVFISADAQWMNYLVEKEAVHPESVALIAGNDLVIAIPKSREPVDKAEHVLGKGRFAMADPDSVPAGRYAKAALESLGIWTAVGGNAVFAENVRVALKMVARGDVDAAIVYGSDVPLEPALQTGYEFADGSHPPIVYSAGQVENGSPRAVQFLRFLQGESARQLLRNSGFPGPENVED